MIKTVLSRLNRGWAGLLLSFLVCLALPAAATQTDRLENPADAGRGTLRGSGAAYAAMDLSGYRVDRAVVKAGQSLSAILRPYGLSAAALFKAGRLARDVFDVRHIQAGRPYAVVRDPLQDLAVRYFIYEKTALDFVVFDFGETPLVYTGSKALKTQIRRISGVIERSLWHAIESQGGHVDLILKLREVFGYRIDFHRLKAQDRFDVLFEEHTDGDRFAGIGAILAARLTVGGSPMAAFRYRHHGIEAYYDRNGINLQKSFLKSPLQSNKITSVYSTRRWHPITRTYQRHPAIDYGAPTGTPVMSVADGRVEKIATSKTAGKYVKIRHFHSYVSQYSHLSAVAPGVKSGAAVKKGAVIGFVGSTGLATGPHLDFRFSQNGRLVDYTAVDLPDGDPVDVACKPDFEQQVQQRLAELESAQPIYGLGDGPHPRIF